MRRRNNSPPHETIFGLPRRRPETFAEYHLAQQAPLKRRHGEPVMQNVIAINSAARQGMVQGIFQGIVSAQATSDEMLLESISNGNRPAMHILYSRHNLRVYRFLLRIVRDGTAAEDLASQVFLDVWRTASQFEGRSQVSTWLLSIARFKALTALRQRRHEDIDQDDVLEIVDEAETPEASLDRSNTSAILRACIAKLSSAHREIINLVYYHEKSVEEAGAIIGIPQSTVKTRMFYARKQLADLLRGAGVDSMAA
jgi:RNA polymerase sigma-70 factor (ECF subfamily)